MQTEICRELEIEFPIFAFSHCRDVVAAVSNVGGLGVLGAVGFSAEQLETELAWIDERVGDKPYGVDIVLPGKYEGKGEQITAEALEEKLRAMIPQEHRDFVKNLMAEAGVAPRSDNATTARKTAAFIMAGSSMVSCGEQLNRVGTRGTQSPIDA